MTKLIREYWPILIILALSIFIVWPLFLPGYFSHHDDLQVMRVFEMRRCLEDLQIPCRWVPDMGYGYGFPLFNYYGVFPYYIGGLLSYILGYIGAAKALFFIPLVLGGISMYFLGKELLEKKAGLFAATLYLFAPYRALDSYVRGAVAESFALALAPLIFLFSLRLVKQRSLLNFLGLVSSLTAFLTTHNIMTLFFIPCLMIWILLCIVKEKKNLRWVGLSLLLSFGLAGFFLLPALTETNLVQIDSLTRFDLNFRVHFVSISQLFLDRSWGYGASVEGPMDTISFQIGWPHWWLVILLVILLVLNLFKINKVIKSPNGFEILTIIYLLLIFLGSIFMMHNKSAFVWELISPLRFVQFPWRFLSLTIFALSLLGGYCLFLIKNSRWQLILLMMGITLIVVLNLSFFKPKDFFWAMTDEMKLSGTEWETQQKAGLLDYLPTTALEPKEPAPFAPFTTQGVAQISNFQNKSNQWSFDINVKDESNVEVPVFDFPNWQTQVNGQPFVHNHKNVTGRIALILPPGVYKVSGNFQNTNIRLLGNSLTIISLLILISLVIYGKTRKNYF